MKLSKKQTDTTRNAEDVSKTTVRITLATGSANSANEKTGVYASICTLAMYAGKSQEFVTWITNEVIAGVMLHKSNAEAL